MIDAQTIHARLGADGWRRVLLACGATEQVLRKKPSQCPACGGKDRYTFDNKWGRGDFFCRQCGAGDGFKLLEKLFGWPFKQARLEIIRIQGWEGEDQSRLLESCARRWPPRKSRKHNRLAACWLCSGRAAQSRTANQPCGISKVAFSGRFPSARDFALILRSSTGTSTSG